MQSPLKPLTSKCTDMCDLVYANWMHEQVLPEFQNNFDQIE